MEPSFANYGFKTARDVVPAADPLRRSARTTNRIAACIEAIVHDLRNRNTVGPPYSGTGQRVPAFPSSALWAEFAIVLDTALPEAGSMSAILSASNSQA